MQVLCAHASLWGEEAAVDEAVAAVEDVAVAVRVVEEEEAVEGESSKRI